MEQVLRADAIASLARHHYHSLALLEARTKYAQSMGRALAWSELDPMTKEAINLPSIGRAIAGFGTKAFGSGAQLMGGLGKAIASAPRAAWSGGLKGVGTAFRSGMAETGQALGRRGINTFGTQARHLVRTGPNPLSYPTRLTPGSAAMPNVRPNFMPAPTPNPAPSMARPMPNVRPMGVSAPPAMAGSTPGLGTPAPAPRPGGFSPTDFLPSPGGGQQQQQQRPMFDIYSGAMLPGREVRASNRAAEALLKLAVATFETDPDRACALVVMSGMEKDAVNAAGWLGRQLGRVARPFAWGKGQVVRGGKAVSKWWGGPRPLMPEQAIGAGHSVQELGVFRQGAVPTTSRSPGIEHFMEPTGNPIQRAKQEVMSRLQQWRGLAQDPLSGEVIQGPGPLARMRERAAQGFSEGLHGPVPGLAPQVQATAQRPVPQVQPRQVPARVQQTPVQAPPQGPYRTPETPPEVPPVSTGALTPEAPTPAGRSSIGRRIMGGMLGAGAVLGVPIALAAGAAPAAAGWMSQPMAPGAYGMGAPMPEMFAQRAVM